MRPIFNEKVVEKGVCGSRKQCTSVLFIGEKSTTSAEKKKKKRERERERENAQGCRHHKLDPNRY